MQNQTTNQDNSAINTVIHSTRFEAESSQVSMLGFVDEATAERRIQVGEEHLATTTPVLADNESAIAWQSPALFSTATAGLIQLPNPNIPTPQDTQGTSASSASSVQNVHSVIGDIYELMSTSTLVSETDSDSARNRSGQNRNHRP